jgi:hypothetical protein
VIPVESSPEDMEPAPWETGAGQARLAQLSRRDMTPPVTTSHEGVAVVLKVKERVMTNRCVYVFHHDDGPPSYFGEGHLTRPQSHIDLARKWNRLGFGLDYGAGSGGAFLNWLREELAAGREPRWRYVWKGLDKDRARDLQNACLAKFRKLSEGGLLLNRFGYQQASAEAIAFVRRSRRQWFLPPIGRAS